MRVFVYGTLMKGHANHRVLAALGARLIGAARTAKARTLVDLGPYPALLACDAERDARASCVHGEVYEIDDADAARALEVLDEFEGCPDLYAREAIAIEGGEEAWTYALACAVPAHARVVEGGRYAGTGRVLRQDAREAVDALDKEAPNDDGSRGQLG